MKIDAYIKEHDLLMSIAHGSEEAFRSLFVLLKDKVYSYSFHFTRSVFTAEEITQEVFLKIWINRASLPEINNIEAWLVTVTRNLCFNQLKRMALEKKIKNSIVNAETNEEENVDNYIFYKDQLQRLGEAMDQLSPQQRLIFRLNREQGMKNEEIARQLNISPNTVKTHMVAALRKIRLFFETHPASIIFLIFFLLKKI
jgi:RNA polymerase sigma-70 factor (ECF subfamily)